MSFFLKQPCSQEPQPVFPCDHSAQVTNGAKHQHRPAAGLKCHFTPS